MPRLPSLAVHRYRFLRSPRWVLFTAAMAGLVVLMLALADWQLRRLDERRAMNDRVTEREAAGPIPVGQLLTLGSSATEAQAAEWRSVTASGVYDRAAEVLIRNRSLAGQPGYHVVTPLRLADGGALLVNRGWIPLEGDGAAPVPAPPPTGPITLTGRVRLSQQRGRFFSPTDPAEGTLTQLYRLDVPRLARQLPYPVLPAYVELLETSLTEPDQPALIPPPELGDGPHLPYAFQWCFFAACVVAGWILAVRRSASARAKAEARVPEAASSTTTVASR